MSFKNRLMLGFIVFGIILIGVAILSIYNLNKSNLKIAHIDNAFEKYIEKKEFFDYQIKHIELKLQTLKNSDIFKEYIYEGTEHEHLKELFLTITGTSSNIMQLRYININGDEKIRIDRKEYDSIPYLLEDKNLQNKANRYYFKDTLSKNKNQLWYSQIDLNKEQGKIEQPIKPVLRVGTPIFKKDKKVGILIINIFMDKLLQKFSKASLYNIYLIDKNGDFISHPNKNKSWNKYIKNGFNIKNIFPNEFRNILENDKYKDKKIFSSTMDIYNSDNLKIVIEPKSFHIKKQLDNQLHDLFIMMVGLLFLSIPFAYLFARAPLKLEEEIEKRDKLLVEQSEIKTQNKILKNKAYFDNLTKIYNRNKFEELFEFEIIRQKRYKGSLSIAVLDIDHFKDVNDTYGHLIGDEILVLVAKIVTESIRKIDIFARWGGEEFIVVFPQTKLEGAIIASNMLREKIHNIEHDSVKDITVSFGVTTYQENDTLTSLFNRCDEALYIAKNSGRNCVKSL